MENLIFLGKPLTKGTALIRRKLLTNFILILILSLIGFVPTVEGQTILYDADFSTNGDGFPNHTTASPPAPAPASANGGVGMNAWVLSYTSTPSTDGTDNIFSVDGGVLLSDDWGGQGIFESISIDVSGTSLVNIMASTVNVSANGNVFEYFYILDGGARVSTGNIPSGDGDPLPYNIVNLDVSGASTLVVGFEFNENGSGDGYSTSLFQVTEPATTTIVEFATTTSSIGEAGITIDVCATITNPDATNATTVEVALAGTGNTATNGTDFSMITFPSTLIFPANSSADQCLTFTITDDALFEGDETVDLILQNPAGGNSAALGANTTHVLTIVDNDNPALVITEIMYNTPSIDDEWIEICNTGGTSENLENLEIHDGAGEKFTFPAGATLAAGACITVSLGSNGDGTYNNECPFTPDYGVDANTNSTNVLNNSGENISLRQSDGTTIIDEVTYSSGDGANGNGSSLHVIDASMNNSMTNSNWQEVTTGGSPGTNSLTSPCATPTLTISNNADINDPCACNLDGTGLADGTFEETVTVNDATGETWTVVAISALNGGGVSPTGIAVNDVLTETPAGSGVFEITFNHSNLDGYSLTVERTSDNMQLMITNVCAVPTITLNPTINASYFTTDATITLGADITNGGVAAGGSPTFNLDGTNNITQIDFDPTTTDLTIGQVSVGAGYTLTGHYETDGNGTGANGTLATPAVPINACPVETTATFDVVAPTTIVTFDALPDCDDSAGGAGTAAADNEMYIHISNLSNINLLEQTTFASTLGSVTGFIAAGNNSGTIQITGLTDLNYGSIITLTATNDGNNGVIEIPVVICGFLVDNGGNGMTEDDVTNGPFCSDQNGLTGPGILVEAAPSSALSSGNDITSTYVYVLVDTDNSNNIITSNNSGLFSAPNVVSGTNYRVYALNVDDGDLAAFNTQLGMLTTLTAGDDILTMMGAFSGFCYTSCWNVPFAPVCFVCPDITALTASDPICSGTATTDLTATIANFFGTENNEANYDVEFVYTTTAAADAAAVYALTNTVIGTEDVAMTGVTSVTEGTFTLPSVATSTTYYIYARIFDASNVVPDPTCLPFAEAQVVVNPLPTPADAPFTICADETSTDLTANNTTVLDGETGTVTWYDGEPGNGGSVVLDDTNTNLNLITDLWAQVTLTATSCQANVDITVTINPLPTPSDAPFTICADETSTDLTANNTTVLDGETGTVTWYNGEPGNGGTPVADDTDTDLTGVTDLWAQVTLTGTGCQANIDVTVTINPLPTPVNAPFNICTNETMTDLTANNTAVLDGETGTVTWYDGEPGNGGTPVVDDTNTDLMTVTNLWAEVTLAGTGCQASVNITINVNSSTTVEAGGPATICSTGTVDLTGLGATIMGGTTTGVWTSSGTGTFDNGGDFDTSTTYTPSAADKTAGTVTLTLTSTNSPAPCTNSSDTVVITITNVSCDSTFPWGGNN